MNGAKWCGNHSSGNLKRPFQQPLNPAWQLASLASPQKLREARSLKDDKGCKVARPSVRSIVRAVTQFRDSQKAKRVCQAAARSWPVCVELHDGFLKGLGRLWTPVDFLHCCWRDVWDVYSISWLHPTAVGNSFLGKNEGRSVPTCKTPGES